MTQPVALTQLLKAPSRQLMSPPADGRLVCHQLTLRQRQLCLLGSLLGAVAAARVQHVIQGSSLCHQLILQPLNQVAATQVLCALTQAQ